MNQGQEIVVPVKKDKHNFLNAFFLAMNGELLLNQVGAKSATGVFNEFTGEGFMQPGGATTSTKNLTRDYDSFIRTNGEDRDQTNEDYKRNDKIIFEFCREYTKNPGEDYVCLVRKKDELKFHFPDHSGGLVFVPRENINKVYIVFLEFEEALDGVHYYNLVASFSGNPRAPHCSKYLIKKDASARKGCSLSQMSKQQLVLEAIDTKIQEVGRITTYPEERIKTNILAKLTAFKTTVSVGLSPQQSERTRVDANLDENVGLQTPSVSVASSDSSYTPSVNERANNLFADLRSFTQTLVPGENVCADKMIIEMLKSNSKRPSLFSGGRRYKKSTQRNLAKQRNKTKRRHVYKNV